MIGLESCFGAVNKVLVKQNGMSLKSLIEKLTVNPRKVMNLERDLFSVGTRAQITVFDPNEKWVFTNEHILSKSSNSPFLGKELIGRVKYVVSKNQFFSM
jgi:dihydroorotase